MKLKLLFFQTALFTNVALLRTMSQVNAATIGYDLHWTSNGGGWLAMMSNLGYAKLFQKVGLWNDTSCSISRFTGFSGGTWFFTQFMFSQSFFTKVHESNQNEIYQFVLDWMDSFIKYQEDIPKIRAPLCSAISPLGLHDNLESLSILCKNIFGTNGDWALFIEGMLKQVSTDVYNDTTFVRRRVNSENLVPALSNTELYTVGGISPTAIVYRDFLHRLFWADTITYISPNQNISLSGNPNIFTIPIAAAHVVKKGVGENASSFVYATEESAIPLYATVATKANPITRRFHFQDWEQFYLYPATNATVYRSLEKPKKYSWIESKKLREPFGGEIPTVAQLTGITSANLALYSTTVPSVWAQYFSTLYFNAKDQNSRILLLAVMKLLYRSKVLRGFSVCSQWPKRCTEYDGRFIDGGFADAHGLSWSIRQYQKGGGSLNKTLKILTTNHNNAGYTDGRFSPFFNNSFNQNREPGDFIWAPGFDGPSSQFYIPFRSMQIFNTYLDYDEMMNNTNITTRITGTNLTASFIETITLDNPVFGVSKGQKVQILLLQDFSSIPSALLTKNDQEANKVPLAELATTIMNNTQLYNIVLDFVKSQ